MHQDFAHNDPTKTRDSTRTGESKKLLELLQSKFGGKLKSCELNLGDAEIRIQPGDLLEIFGRLKQDSDLAFDFFVNVTCVDWLDQKPERFEVVYHLMSIAHKYRLRIKIPVPEEDTKIESVTKLWSGANFMEREVYDMFGITFQGHPDLRRTLTYDEFVGHPLRKDYPVQGKQPRVPLRYPEVRNTAVDMQRPPLVHINPRSTNQGKGGASA